MPQQKVLVASGDRDFAQVVADALEGRSVGLVDSVAAAVTVAEGGEVGVVLVAPDVDFDAAVDALADLPTSVGKVMVVRRPTTVMMRSAMRVGVTDVLGSGFGPEELADAIDRAWPQAAAESEAAADEPSGGRVVTVFGPKGGCGKSTVAANLAAVAATRGQRVCLLDLDLQFGDAAIMFQLRPTYAVDDVVRVLDELDPESIVEYVTRHESGVGVLAGPSRPALADDVRAEHVEPLLALLRQAYDLVVVDTPPLFTDVVIAAIDETDRLVVLGGYDVPSIKNLRLGLTTLGQMGVSAADVDVVMSRANAKVGLRLAEVERTLGTTIDVAIPSHRDVTISLNHGVPVVLDNPKSSVSVAMGKLADLVLGGGEPPTRTADRTASAAKRGLGGLRPRRASAAGATEGGTALSAVAPNPT